MPRTNHRLLSATLAVTLALPLAALAQESSPPPPPPVVEEAEATRRYADGSEELYDHRSDPNEWTNLAGDAAFAAEKTRLAKGIPASSAHPLPGSKARPVELRDGKVYWEGVEIDPDAGFK
jgi:hypothetical protein